MLERTQHRTGIREMARQLSLSVGTVSKALNGQIGVRPHTRARVLEAARAAGYTPDYQARILRRKRSRSIGLLLPTLSNPVYSERIADIYQAAAEQGYDLLVTSSERHTQRGIQLCREMIGRRMEAVILAGNWDNESVHELLAAGIRVLQINPGEYAAQGAAVLKVDRAEGVRLLLAHLLDLGHRRPLLVGNWIHDIGRKRGLRQALQQAGRPEDEYQFASDDDLQDMMPKACRQTLEAFAEGGRFSAVMASNDLGAIGAIAALNWMGLRVPDDVSVTGMDNIMAAKFHLPALTTVSQTHLNLGRRAMEMVIEILKEKLPADVRHDLAPHLVVRQSSGPASMQSSTARADDPAARAKALVTEHFSERSLPCPL